MPFNSRHFFYFYLRLKMELNQTKNLELSIDYIFAITTVKDIESILEDEQFENHLNCIKDYCKLADILEILEENKITQLARFLVLYLDYYYIDRYLEIFETVIIDKKSKFFNEVIFTLKNFTHNSAVFCGKFLKQDGLKIVFLYLKNLGIFVNKAIDVESKDEAIIFNERARDICFILFNLSKLRDVSKDEWRQLKVLELLSDFINLLAVETLLFKELFIYFFLTTGFIFEEKDLVILSTKGIKQGIVVISELVGTCADTLSVDKVSRKEYKLITDKDRKIEVIHIDDHLSLTELLECLYQFAIVDDLKCVIYKMDNIYSNLCRIIFDGNDFEKEYTLKLVFQLCFNDKIAEDFSRNEQFNYMIDSLKDNRTRNLNEICSGINLLLSKLKKMLSPKTIIFEEIDDCIVNTDNVLMAESNFSNDIEVNKSKKLIARLKKAMSNIRHPSPPSIPPPPPPPYKKDSRYDTNFQISQGENTISKHIMISYNSKSKEICLKIKDELEKYGFRVWIDVENICGSSLESMAKAIEECSCVLMCMTEKYKQSPNCRLEAEYSVKLNKPIIPLIMESGYKPEGWLGIILGSKINIDFTKADIEKSFKRLSIELNYLIRIGKIPFPKTEEHQNSKNNLMDFERPIENQNDPSKKTRVDSCLDFAKTKKDIIKNWTQKDVNKWIISNNFDKNIVKSIYPCNGEHLTQMYEMYIDIPEKFYNSLNSKQLFLKDLVHFSNELKRLFI